MTHPKAASAPASPEQSSSPWPLGGWFRAINDWLRLLSPAGVDKYDTDWITIPLDGTKFAAQGSIPPQVRRQGRDLKYRGLVRPLAGGNFTASATHIIAADGAISDVNLRPTADEYMGIAGNQSIQLNGARLVITALGGLQINTGPTSSPYYSLYGVRSSTD